MTWLSIIVAGILTYFTRMTMIALIDRNMLGDTLGIRRIQTPMKNLYPLRYQIQDIIGMSQHRALQNVCLGHISI